MAVSTLHAARLVDFLANSDLENPRAHVIAEVTGIPVASVSRNLRRLVAAGIVERSEEKARGRRVVYYYYYTPAERIVRAAKRGQK